MACSFTLVVPMSAVPIDYEFDQAPAAGSSVEIFPGLRWVRQPLPIALDHINLWLLYDADTFSIVDTGINTGSSRRVWQEVLNQCVSDRRADKIVATHLHPDHIGLAGWLCETYERPLWMTRAEYLMCRLLCEDTGKPAPSAGVDFYRASGMDEQALERYQASFGRFGQVVWPLPQNYVRIQHGDQLTLGPYTFEIVVGSGHSPEHACLYCDELGVVISGDQILPSISSIVAVWPTEPEANPLKHWLDSCHYLKDRFPDDTLVLPSHGLPFRGAARRLQALIDHHEQRLEALQARCREPQRAVDVFDVLFNSPIDGSNMIMAVGESLAHFNYLRELGTVNRRTDESGVHWYERA